MRITLNLASRPFIDMGPAIKRLRIGMGVLAALALLLLLGLHAFHRKAEEARTRERAVDAQIASIELERQQFQNLMRQPTNAEILSHVAALNALFDEKAFSWTLAMEDLETVLPGGVQVSTLEPIRAKDGKITLHLRVIGPRDRAVELVQNLEHSRRFLMPRIVGEAAEVTGASGEPVQPVSASNRVNFDLLADYNTSLLSEPRHEEKLEKPTAEGTPASAASQAAHRANSPLHSAMQRPAAPANTGVSRPLAAHSKPRAGEPR